MGVEQEITETIDNARHTKQRFEQLSVQSDTTNSFICESQLEKKGNLSRVPYDSGVLTVATFRHRMLNVMEPRNSQMVIMSNVLKLN